MTENLNELLEEILKILELPYLSDLHQNCQHLNSRAKAGVLAIPPERYSLETWNATASYIKGRRCCFKTIEEAKTEIVTGK